MVRRETLAVTGMSCDGCERNVENALERTTGVRKATADHQSDTVEAVVEDDIAETSLVDVIHSAGYDVSKS